MEFSTSGLGWGYQVKDSRAMTAGARSSLFSVFGYMSPLRVNSARGLGRIDAVEGRGDMYSTFVSGKCYIILLLITPLICCPGGWGSPASDVI